VAEVVGVTFDHFEAITNAGVVGAAIVGGHLILTTKDGTDIDVGAVASGLAAATTAAAGVVELATDAETQAGSDASRAVTPSSLATVVATSSAKGLVELATDAEATAGADTSRAVTPANLLAVLAAYAAAKDSDITAIAAISPSNDDIIQRKSGAWTNRTMAQLATDISGTGEFPDVVLWNGTAYADTDATGADIYIGPNDPTATVTVANGAIWFDTTGA
jgi:hypothetical protein